MNILVPVMLASIAAAMDPVDDPSVVTIQYCTS